MKSLLIKDTTVDERMAIVKESLNFGDGECEGVDMDDMYDDYIFGRRELADIRRCKDTLNAKDRKPHKEVSGLFLYFLIAFRGTRSTPKVRLWQMRIRLPLPDISPGRRVPKA